MRRRKKRDRQELIGTIIDLIMILIFILLVGTPWILLGLGLPFGFVGG